MQQIEVKLVAIKSAFFIVLSLFPLSFFANTPFNLSSNRYIIFVCPFVRYVEINVCARPKCLLKGYNQSAKLIDHIQDGSAIRRWPDVWSNQNCKFMSYDLLQQLFCPKLRQYEVQRKKELKSKIAKKIKKFCTVLRRCL